MPADPLTPPDRGALLTEQRLDASASLDQMTIAQTLAVINEQDATVAAVVGRAMPAISALVEAAVRARRAGGRLIYFGAGTSGRLGVLDASECPPTFFCAPGEVVGIIAGGDKALRHSIEGAEDDPHGADGAFGALGVEARDVIVGIAAGGTTPYVLGGLHLAKQRGATVAMVCCVPWASVTASPAAAHLQGAVPDHVIALPVGAEVVTGSTRMKAGTATKLALNMISTATMVQLGKTWGNLMVDLRASNAKLVDRAARIIMGQTNLPRDRAVALVHEASGRVKVALVMALREVDAVQAAALLEQHAGRLRPILGPPR